MIFGFFWKGVKGEMPPLPLVTPLIRAMFTNGAGGDPDFVVAKFGLCRMSISLNTSNILANPRGTDNSSRETPKKEAKE